MNKNKKVQDSPSSGTNQYKQFKWMTVVRTGNGRNTEEFQAEDKESAIARAVKIAKNHGEISDEDKVESVEVWVHGLELPPNERHAEINPNEPLNECSEQRIQQLAS